jgi:hypothetical protein
MYSVSNGYKNCEGFQALPDVPQQDQRQDDGAPLPEPTGTVDDGSDLPF